MSKNNIAFLRRRRNLTQIRLSEMIDLPVSTLNRIESGETAGFEKHRAKLAAALACAPEDLDIDALDLPTFPVTGTVKMAWDKFRQMVIAQGGDVAQVDDPDKLPQAQYVEVVTAKKGRYAAAMDTNAIGWCAVHLGAGRLVKSDELDYSVGLVLPLKISDYVAKGEPIATIQANDPSEISPGTR